ncbi:Protein of unknown function [Gryllus bimaculatus]|nr:Protein of unknown function [Gryllus bimaculatus]
MQGAATARVALWSGEERKEEVACRKPAIGPSSRASGRGPVTMQAARRGVALAASCAWLLCGLLPTVPAKEITLHSLGPCKAECLESARKRIRIDPANDTSAWLVEDMEMKLVEAEDYALSGFVTIHAELEKPVETYVTTTHCTSASDVSTCQQNLEMTFPDICAMLRRKKCPELKLLEHLENFQRSCPLKAGKYFLNQFPVKSKDVNKLCSSDGVYDVCVAVRSGTTSGCLQMNFSLNGK